jgi:exonuclease SbcC
LTHCHGASFPDDEISCCVTVRFRIRGFWSRTEEFHRVACGLAMMFVFSSILLTSMFDFLFKRRPAPSSSAPTVRPQPSTQPDPSPPVLARQDALKAAAALSDEASAAAFILQCQFADARLQAAELIRSKPMLEQVEQAMRNADRRVAKLVRGRLDALALEEARQQQAQAGLEHAQRLVQEPLLMPSQVAELDRAWQAIDLPPGALLQSFDQMRAALGERLQQQAALQRAVIDGLARVRRALDGEPVPVEAVQALDTLELELAAHMAAQEAPSLPKNMLSEFAQELQAARRALQVLAARQEATAAREQEIARIAASRPPPELAQPALSPESTSAIASDTKQNFLDAITGMEQALQNGALQTAMECDKTARALDLKAARLSDAQTARLVQARSELGRLQGWAKWGGNISREELLKAADGLPIQALAPPELAKKVGSLRERWKSLDVSAGSASKELWERFDVACTTAYAPAAEHFKKLADERQHNAAKAQAMIVEVRQFAASSHGNAEAAPQADSDLPSAEANVPQGDSDLLFAEANARSYVGAPLWDNLSLMLQPLIPDRP